MELKKGAKLNEGLDQVMGVVMIDGRVVSSGQWVWIAAAARQTRPVFLRILGQKKTHV